jgi:hypothetical protein
MEDLKDKIDAIKRMLDELMDEPSEECEDEEVEEMDEKPKKKEGLTIVIGTKKDD